jgi:rod shape-determining protein MreC
LHVANNMTGKFYQTYTDTREYLNLKRINDSLATENAGLRAQLYESKYDNKVDSATITDSISKRFVQHYSYITARVIRNSVNEASNLIYLNRGKLQGVQRQMGVIGPNGVVGQVVSATNNYSAVMSMLHKDFKVSAKFKKNEFFGNMHWDGMNSRTAILEDIPKHVAVKEGDTLVTSGFSKLFPRNIMLGTVKSVKMEPDKNFLEIKVRISTEFNNLSYVYVVNNTQKEELQLLDSLTAK